MKLIKKGLVLVVAVFATLVCLVGVACCVEVGQNMDLQEGKVIVFAFYLLMTVGFGLVAFICFKLVFRKVEIPQKDKLINIPITEASTQSEMEECAQPVNETSPTITANVVYQEVPQETLNDMRMTYTGQQASNDMRIIDESLKIMETTSDIDTFLSRYETAMKCVLTLEQAKKAGQRIALPDGYSQSLANAKSKALAATLYRSFNKELEEISKLKTESGRLNRINRYQEKLRGMYEDEFEFFADEAYKDIMQKLEDLK